MEQVAMAALDVKELHLALSLIKEIRGKFPRSQRTLRLTVRPSLPPMKPALQRNTLRFAASHPGMHGIQQQLWYACSTTYSSADIFKGVPHSRPGDEARSLPWRMHMCC